MNDGKPTRLHLGAHERIDGWTNVNVKPGPNVDVVADVSDLSAFADDSVDEVYASHVFEHLSMNRIGKSLLGVLRLLKPGGRFRIAVPDLDILAGLLREELITVRGRWEICRMIYGGDIDEHDRHGCGFTHDLLRECLTECGFTDVRRVASFGLLKDNSEARFLGYRISLNMEAVKPCKPNA